MFGVGFGEGLEPALQGFLSYCVGSMSKAKIFSLYAFVDAAAELTAGPLMARLLAIGRTDTHPSNGICFLASSVSSQDSRYFGSFCSTFHSVYSVFY